MHPLFVQVPPKLRAFGNTDPQALFCTEQCSSIPARPCAYDEKIISFLRGHFSGLFPLLVGDRVEYIYVCMFEDP